jgi:hypothetical protein
MIESQEAREKYMKDLIGQAENGHPLTLKYTFTLYLNDAMHYQYGDLLKLMMVWSSIMLYRAPINEESLVDVFRSINRDRIEFTHSEQFEKYYLPLEYRLRDQIKQRLGKPSN